MQNMMSGLLLPPLACAFVLVDVYIKPRSGCILPLSSLSDTLLEHIRQNAQKPTTIPALERINNPTTTERFNPQATYFTPRNVLL